MQPILAIYANFYAGFMQIVRFVCSLYRLYAAFMQILRKHYDIYANVMRVDAVFMQCLCSVYADLCRFYA